MKGCTGTASWTGKSYPLLHPSLLICNHVLHFLSHAPLLAHRLRWLLYEKRGREILLFSHSHTHTSTLHSHLLTARDARVRAEREKDRRASSDLSLYHAVQAVALDAEQSFAFRSLAVLTHYHRLFCCSHCSCSCSCVRNREEREKSETS